MTTTDAVKVPQPRPATGKVKALEQTVLASPTKLVRVIGTSNLATLSGVQTVDSVALKLGDVVLLTAQTTTHQNRLWTVMQGTWIAPLIADHPEKLRAGTKVTAQEGTANAGKTYRLQTTGDIVLGTTALSWTLDGSTGSGDVVGPASATSGRVATFNGTTGKLIQDGGTLLSALATSASVTSAISTHAGATDPHGDRSYADGLFAANDAMLFKGVIDCSSNPNYPAASAGHVYKISVAGKIGGASGVNVEVGDTAICAVDGTAAGNQATVGANWYVVQVNLDGAVIGPASSTNLRVAVFSGTTGKLLADGGTLLSDLLTSASAAGTYPTKAATTDLIDNAGDSLTGTADNTLGKLAKGTALQVRRMNAAANAEEWATVGAGSALFGDGSDGNLTVSGTTTITTDKNYDTLIVQSGGILIVAGARVRSKTLCQVDAGGIIHADGGAGAAAGTAGTATAQGMLGLPSAGGAGGTAAGSAGVTVSSGSGGAGGAGGLGASGAGGAAGSFSSLLGNFGTTGRGVEFVMLGHVYANGIVAPAKGGAGGGGGGGDGTAGGGGGAGGGVFTLAAKSLTNAGSIRANGGAGGSPAAGNRGGGGGGGGGWIGLIYNTKSGAGTITCTGGTGGTKQGTGVNGTNGSDGTVMEFVNA